MAEPTAEQKRMLASGGYAMPDGSYYIRNGNVDDLNNAIKAVGRGGADHDVIRKHIMKRARAKDINRPDLIPDTWNSDGSLKHWDLDSYIKHFGVKGMKWGVRRGGSRGAPSMDAARASDLAKRVKAGGGTHVLSNAELQHLVTRRNLERQHASLAPGSDVDRGRAFIKNRVSDVKLTLDAIDTGKRVYDQLEPVLKKK